MAQQIRRFSVGQTAKVLGALYGIVGLVAMPFFFLATAMAPDTNRGFGFGAGFAVAIPFIYAALGFVFTAIGCLIYNWIAGMVGGIEIQLEDGDQPV